MAEERSKPGYSWRTGYKNPWTTWKEKSIKELAFWLAFEKHPSPPTPVELDAVLPIVKPNFGDIPQNGVKATWLGHASVLFQLDGVRILCDPHFSERSSPSQSYGPKRFRSPPCTVEDLEGIDAIVISHNHYDHLDTRSVVQLSKRFPDAEWFVPVGLAKWMHSTLSKGKKKIVHELTWWEERQLRGHPDVRVAATPAQHWSSRTLLDRNSSLWCGWAILGPKHQVWFAGDTGYCAAFSEIGQAYGGFDLAAIPIGAYEPRWFMCHQHVDPVDAVKIHQDIKSKRSLGIHWGTFILTSEPFLEPPKCLAKTLEDAKIDADKFVTVNHGETLFTKDDNSFSKE